MSNVSKLRDDLVDKVIDLGISGEFVAHPAFVAVLSDVDGLIGNMNISDPENVYVNEEDGKVAFSYTGVDGNKYEFQLRIGDDSIRCVRLEVPHEYVGNSGKVTKQKIAIEKYAVLDRHGDVTVTTNCGSIDNIDCDERHVNKTGSTERCVYNEHGVMTQKEYKFYSKPARNYDRDEEVGYFYRAGSDEVLSVARFAATYPSANDDFNRRTLLIRDQFDTARIVHQDRDSGEEYYGVVPLHQEHGLRDMDIANGYNTFPIGEVVIHPLMQSEIDEMITREADVRVALGLREFAHNRATYSYDSKKDAKHTSSKAIGL